ncbi:hypothetical protein QQP08_020150 [Theobroma cacao]|nr:hypothetical protein QQP08_020150 [Theobroma cacao]
MMVELFVLGCTGVVVFLHGANFFFHILSQHIAVRSLSINSNVGIFVWSPVSWDSLGGRPNRKTEMISFLHASCVMWIMAINGSSAHAVTLCKYLLMR